MAGLVRTVRVANKEHKDSIWTHQFDHDLLSPFTLNVHNFFLVELQQFGLQIWIAREKMYTRAGV
jgi:hypothetical protein